MTGVLKSRQKFGHRQQGRKSHEDRGSDWSDASTNQGTRDCWQIAEARGDFGESMALLTLSFQTSSLHNWDKTPSLW